MSKMILIDEATVNLAIEALEAANRDEHRELVLEYREGVITALHKALASEAIEQPTYRAVNAVHEGKQCYVAEQPAPVAKPRKQEPVATCSQEIIHAITMYGDARADQDANNAPMTSHERLADCILLVREALAEQPAQQQEACPTCGEYEPRTGTCGTSPNDKRALCNRNAPQPAQQEPVISKGAYDGAREDLAIWKKRALEAEALNRKFIADINGQTFMGEPAQQEPVALNRDGMQKLLEQSGYDTACPEEKSAFLSGVRHREAESLDATPSPQPAQQEPVAGLLVGQDSDGRYVSIAAKAHADTLPLGEYKLYTSPPASKPLPKGEWPKHPSKYVGEAYVGYSTSDLDNYAMQVLSAHGIEVQP